MKNVTKIVDFRYIWRQITVSQTDKILSILYKLERFQIQCLFFASCQKSTNFINLKYLSLFENSFNESTLYSLTCIFYELEQKDISWPSLNEIKNEAIQILRYSIVLVFFSLFPSQSKNWNSSLIWLFFYPFFEPIKNAFFFNNFFKLCFASAWK